MQKRFVAVWFRHFATDWFSIRRPRLRTIPFVLKTLARNRMVITASSAMAERKGVYAGMVLADAKAFTTDLEVLDDEPENLSKVLKRLAEWCIRFTPTVSVDPPNGLIMDVTGCAHLWGGDLAYVHEITKRLNDRGYDVRVTISDTAASAWAFARFSTLICVESGKHIEALMPLPPEALQLETSNVDRLHKLGLKKIRQFMSMPRPALRRRFGASLLHQLDKATGSEMELLTPIIPVEPYEERLPCLEPIVTLTGIEIALQQLLETLCYRLQQEQKGLRVAIFKGYRVDGKVESITITTNRPSHHVEHLFKLFEIKLSKIEPALGIELFVLIGPTIEEHLSQQERMWEASGGLMDERLSELLDRLATRVGMDAIHRYLPEEHYWPERSFKLAKSLQEEPSVEWPADKPRPLQVLRAPEKIAVTAPIPDYPPMLFRYKGKVHQIVKADGPERIEQEWWLEEGQHRDYYSVEDEDGHRYWIFRLGHYHDTTYQWFIHGFFA